jgi:hypothetical protein
MTFRWAAPEITAQCRGGWNPFQGGFGSGCLNDTCGGWDGFRGWGNF